MAHSEIHYLCTGLLCEGPDACRAIASDSTNVQYHNGYSRIAPPETPVSTGLLKELNNFPGGPIPLIAAILHAHTSNYESAWTWDIFLLSMLDEMVNLS